MKRNYQKPSLKVVHIAAQQHLLSDSMWESTWGSPATKAAKARGNSFFEDDIWDDEDY